MFPIIIFSPLIDIILISIVFNGGAYCAYAYIYGVRFHKTTSVNIKLSLAELLLIVANYGFASTYVQIAGADWLWTWWYVWVSLSIETVCFIAYKWYFRLSWSAMMGNTKK